MKRWSFIKVSCQSRLKMRILLTSVDRKRLSTVLQREPVPPVISNTLSLNMAIRSVYLKICIVLISDCHSGAT